MKLTKELLVGTPIDAKHSDGTTRPGIITEVYDETPGGSALAFYRHQRTVYVLRVGQGDSYDIIAPPKQTAPGVLVLDRIDGVKQDYDRVEPGDVVFTDPVELILPTRLYHCGKQVGMDGDDTFFPGWMCNVCYKLGIVVGTCIQCASGWCDDHFKVNEDGLKYE